MILIPAILEGYRSLKDKTLKLTYETSEPTPEQLYQIARLSQKYGFLAFKEDELKTDEVKMLEGLKSDLDDNGKTPSQRLRGVFYRCWEQDNQGYTAFTDYYNRKMEDLITHFKNKLD